MGKLVSKMLIAGIVILFQTTLCFAQDSSKIIILSSKVGASIDSEEHDYYKLFQTYDDFTEAVIYQGIDSLFYYRITFLKDGSLKDTTIEISYGLMINWAGKIEHFELLIKGDYRLDPASVTLRYANGKIVRIPAADKKKFQTSGNYFYKRIPLNEKKLDTEKLIQKDFELGVSFGIVYNSATFDGLGNVFNLLEEKIPEEPYTIQKSNYTFNATPLFSIGILGLYKNMIIGEFEYSFSIHDNDYSTLNYGSFIVSFSYLFQFSQTVLPYLSAGYMGYDFKVVKNYGTIVRGRAGRLESITLNGKANGPIFGLGVIFNITNKFNINLFGRYKILGNPQVKESQYYNPSDFETNVDANGFEIGVKLIVK